MKEAVVSCFRVSGWLLEMDASYDELYCRHQQTKAINNFRPSVDHQIWGIPLSPIVSDYFDGCARTGGLVVPVLQMGPRTSLRPTSPTSVQTEQKVVRMDYETARYVFPPVGAFPTDKIPKATRIRAPPRPLRIRNRTDRLPPDTQETMCKGYTGTAGTVEAAGLGGVTGG
jgi:hypothetical protein